MTAPLVAALAERMNAAGIRYCHWKSNVSLAKAMAGHEDLDLFVDRSCLAAALAVLGALGFKAAVLRRGHNPPGVLHYYALDDSSGLLIHVHLFSRMISGESLAKSHLLPFEAMVLDVTSGSPLPLPERSAELVLFVLRTFIKYGSPTDLLVLRRRSIRRELDWLMQEARLPEALSLLRTHCPVVDEELFRHCLESLQDDNGLARRVLLALRVRRRLVAYTKWTVWSRLGAYTNAAWRSLVRRLTRREDKVLQSGGAVIAFVGPEATGKSTLVEETRRWLGSAFAVRAVHAGKPPGSWLTAPANLFVPLLREVAPRWRTSRIEGHVGEGSSDIPPVGAAGLAYALRAVAVAWERRRLLIRARRAAAQGDLVLCDRYPSTIIGAMDSPRLRDRMETHENFARLWNALARRERRLYGQIPPPDLVLRLRVSLEVAQERNRGRDKSGREGEGYLESRRQAPEWSRPDARRVVDIDTGGPLPATIRAVQRALWDWL